MKSMLRVVEFSVIVSAEVSKGTRCLGSEVGTCSSTRDCSNPSSVAVSTSVCPSPSV
ncbi:hypothetical protein [Jatrophihabitans endophyticus]|uniref:hypothetical protein n=1 Tax=Jatrophihabitans endophyticus TaxID=1206085 RepID=UPI001356717F|nr:hypothetical protein [Jatrophihabitans endophyticus]